MNLISPDVIVNASTNQHAKAYKKLTNHPPRQKKSDIYKFLKMKLSNRFPIKSSKFIEIRNSKHKRVRVIEVYRVEVRFVLELEHISDNVSVGRVQTGFQCPPKSLKNVLN